MPHIVAILRDRGRGGNGSKNETSLSPIMHEKRASQNGGRSVPISPGRPGKFGRTVWK